MGVFSIVRHLGLHVAFTLILDKSCSETLGKSICVPDQTLPRRQGLRGTYAVGGLLSRGCIGSIIFRRVRVRVRTGRHRILHTQPSGLPHTQDDATQGIVCARV